MVIKLRQALTNGVFNQKTVDGLKCPLKKGKVRRFLANVCAKEGFLRFHLLLLMAVTL